VTLSPSDLGAIRNRIQGKGGGCRSGRGSSERRVTTVAEPMKGQAVVELGFEIVEGP
jgi:hypothetical protein